MDKCCGTCEWFGTYQVRSSGERFCYHPMLDQRPRPDSLMEHAMHKEQGHDCQTYMPKDEPKITLDKPHRPT